MNWDIVFTHMQPAKIIAGIVFLSAAFLWFSYHQFSVPSRTSLRIFLAFLRSLLLGIIFLIILDPYWNQHRENKWWIGLMIDTSPSMGVQLKDDMLSRKEQVLNYLNGNEYVQELLRQGRVKKIYSAASALSEAESYANLSNEGKTSDLLGAVRTINHTYQDDADNIGWFLFSDGAATDLKQNQEDSYVDLNETIIPWAAVEVGARGPVPNIRMESPAIPEFGFVGEIIPVEVKWNAAAVSDLELELKVRLNGKEYLQKKVNAENQNFSFEIKITSTGDHFLDLEMTPFPGEGSLEDNHTRVWFRGFERKMRVFYSESFYKQENLFKKALEEDKEFEVKFASSLIGFSKKMSVPFIKDPLHGFPRTRQDLQSYDVIVLSDVKRSLLSDDQVTWIRDLVKEEGGALVMIGGMDSFGDGGYVGSEIEAILPVEISEEYKKDNFIAARGTSENTFVAQITEGSENHPILQLGSDLNQNLYLWRSMPELGGYNYVGRLKPAAVSLLEHPSDESSFGSRVILAVQNFGKGRTLAFTSDITDNWGHWFQYWKDDKGEWVFAKFWRGALKWLTENRQRKKYEPIDFDMRPSFLEENSEFEIQIQKPAGIQEKSVLQLELLKGTEPWLSEMIDLESSVTSWKKTVEQAGDYQIKLTLNRNLMPPLVSRKSFTVHPARIESKHLEVRSNFLQELAKRTDGTYIPLAQADSGFKEAVEQMLKKHLRAHSTPMWHHPITYGVILGILFIDWVIRKKSGLE